MTFVRDDEAQQKRWALIVEHRTRLVRLAQSLGLPRADAEDCAHDAMLRVVKLDDLDERTLSGLLTTVTKRSAVDQHRARAHQARAWMRHAGRRELEAAPDERVCDVAQADHARQLLPGLPERERAVLLLRADGKSTVEAARTMGVTAKSAESALTRARARLVRRVVIVVGAAGAGKDRLSVGSSTAWASVAATAVTVGIVATPFLPAPAEPGRAGAPAPPASTAPVAGKVANQPQVRAVAQPADLPHVQAAESPVVRPRPAAAPQELEVVVDDQRAGPVWTRQSTIERDGEPTVDAVQRCLEEGIVISPSVIGCPPAR